MNTSPNSYVARLKLDFDPFEIKAVSKGFFSGGGRQELLDELISLAVTSGSVLAVTGELGVGKTTLAQELVRKLGKQVICAHIQATLFMNQDQFLELIMSELELSLDQNKSPLDALGAFINDLALDARLLVLVIDDAQELASDVHSAIAKLLRRNSGGGFSVIMLGEGQLQGLLQRGLPAALSQQIQYLDFPLFSRQDSEEYARHKLSRAGFRKPLPLSGGEMGRAHNASAGIPGKLNVQLIRALSAATEAASPISPAAEAGSSLVQLGKGYWVAAGSLLVTLLLVVLWPGREITPGQRTGGQAIPVQVNRSSQVVVPVAAGSSSAGQSAAPPVPASANQQSPGSSEPAEATTSAVLDEVMPAADSVVELPVAAEQVAQPLSESSAAAESVSSSSLTAFERSLLAAAPDSYTVQVLGSRSVASIRDFLSQHGELSGSGYFETRYQNQPWYVVVAGNFSQRQSAEQAIAQMPAEVRRLQPWVRSVGDIQSDLQELHQLP